MIGVIHTAKMRKYSITLLFGIVALNCFLGYLTQILAGPMHRAFMQYGTKLPRLTMIAISLPPWFYVMAAVALLVIIFGLRRHLADNKLAYAAVALLAVDVAGLLATLWGYCGTYMEMNVGTK